MLATIALLKADELDAAERVLGRELRIARDRGALSSYAVGATSAPRSRCAAAISMGPRPSGGGARRAARRLLAARAARKRPGARLGRKRQARRSASAAHRERLGRRSPRHPVRHGAALQPRAATPRTRRRPSRAIRRARGPETRFPRPRERGHQLGRLGADRIASPRARRPGRRTRGRRTISCPRPAMGHAGGDRTGARHPGTGRDRQPRSAASRTGLEQLERSPARLLLAEALVDQGAALRRAGRRMQAREPLRRGLDIAAASRAHPLADRARQSSTQPVSASAATLRPASPRSLQANAASPSTPPPAQRTARSPKPCS